MLKVACLKCHWSWSLNQDAVQAAMTEMGNDSTHYSVECPRCRRVNKIPRKQLEHALLFSPKPASASKPGDEAKIESKRKSSVSTGAKSTSAKRSPTRASSKKS